MVQYLERFRGTTVVVGQALMICERCTTAWRPAFVLFSGQEGAGTVRCGNSTMLHKLMALMDTQRWRTQGKP